MGYAKTKPIRINLLAVLCLEGGLYLIQGLESDPPRHYLQIKKHKRFIQSRHITFYRNERAWDDKMFMSWSPVP